MNPKLAKRCDQNHRPSSSMSCYGLRRHHLHARGFASDLAALGFAVMDAPREHLLHTLLAASGGDTPKGIHLLDRQAHPLAATLRIHAAATSVATPEELS